jgi:hypothetical protein
MAGGRIEYVVSERGTYVPVLRADAQSASLTFIVWRPSGNGGDAKTWLEVMALLGTRPGALIYCDDPLIEVTQYVVTAGTFDVREAWFVSPGNGEQEVNLDVGAVVQNLAGVHNVIVQGLDTVAQLTFPSSQPNTSFSVVGDGQDAGLISGAAGPLISMPNNTSLLLNLKGFAVVNGAGLIVLGDSCNVNLLASVENTTAVGDDSFATTHAGSSLDIFQDGTLTQPTFGAFAGTVTLHAFGMTAGFGTTGQRPTDPNTGCLYYDTTVPALLVWDGAAWKTVTVT